jgi:hypothetical protein
MSSAFLKISSFWASSTRTRWASSPPKTAFTSWWGLRHSDCSTTKGEATRLEKTLPLVCNSNRDHSISKRKLQKPERRLFSIFGYSNSALDCGSLLLYFNHSLIPFNFSYSLIIVWIQQWSKRQFDFYPCGGWASIQDTRSARRRSLHSSSPQRNTVKSWVTHR